MTPAHDRIIQIDYWLEAWLNRQPRGVRLIAEAAILSASAALVIVVAVLFTQTPGG